MKKTLIALTLAALPMAASAEVVLYGKIKGGVEVSKYKDVKGTQTNIVDYGSRIGFKGQEQLNGSLKAIWQLESRVDIAGGNGRTFGTRDSFVGLTGDFGTVKAGYFHNPVSRLNDKLDQWEYFSNAAGLGTFTRSNEAAGRAVGASYMTPDFGGFTAEVYVAPSDNNHGTPFGLDENGDVTARIKDKALYGLGLSYKHDSGFFADAAGTYVKNTTTVDGKDKDGYQALAQFGYDADRVFAGAAYQRTSRVDNFGTNANPYFAKSGNEVALTGAFKVDDSLRLKATAAYGFGFKDEDGDKFFGNGKYYQGIVGADYALSKRTIVNGQVGYINFGSSEYRKENTNQFLGRYGTVSVGMTHAF